MIRRFLEAGEKKLQMLHQVIFYCPALPKNVKRNILHFEGYDTDDYEGRTMVRERARDMEEGILQFIGCWDWKRIAQWMD
jgi:methyl coenzyme M reductase gamma subunit